MSIVPGSIVAGTRIGAYQILAPLGAGGMGEVYRARDAKLGRDVAIKILPAAFTLNPERLARFEREARVLASLNHPHVGGIYGIEDSEGIRALVLELVEGDTLADRIARGALPAKDALAIAGQIADALDSAHEKGIVHRDLKPPNIKITPNGVVKVLDFGLAKVDGAEASPLLSQSPTMTVGATGGGVILGTAAYMSPEQARGQVVDKRSDIWSFGCVLYEMLAGRTTFRGATVSDLIVAILEKEPDWAALPADTPAAIRRLLRRCLEKDPRRRLRDIADAAIDIDDVVHGATTENVAASTGKSFPRSLLIGAALLVVGAIALGMAVWLVANRPADARMAPPQFSRMVRVTSGPAKEVGPVISPDGKWVAYVSDERGPNDVWVKFLSGGAPSNLTASAPLEIGINTAIGGLDISPDGTRIAVQARLRGATTPFATWEIPAPLPGPPHKLLEDGLLGMRWSPDGRRLTYIRAGASAGDALWIADADGTNRRELIKAQGGLHIHWPVWSTDGFVYYMRTVATIGNLDQAEIYRINSSGGPAEAVVSTLRRAMHPLPLPDGRGLIYASNPTSGEMSLWWRPAAGGEPVRLTTGVGEYAEPRLSSNGQALVATAYDIHQALVRVSLAATSLSQRSPVTDGYGGDLDPTISPVGTSLVFSSWRLGERKLWTSSIDGTNAQPLTTGAGFDDRPAFSPDGRQVAFVSDRGGRRAIWLVDADGGAPRKLVDASLTGGVSWSNDGREIVYAAGAGDWPGLWTVTVTDGRVRRIATPGVATDPAWSPARDLIAYMQPNTTGPTVVKLAFVTSKGEPQYAAVPSPPEVPTGFNNGLVAWSPDGRQLAVISQNTNAPAAIWIVTLETAGLSYRKLTQLPNGPRIRGLAWTRDGSAIIFGQHDSASDIVLLDQVVENTQP